MLLLSLLLIQNRLPDFIIETSNMLLFTEHMLTYSLITLKERAFYMNARVWAVDKH
jgi:hypothetical protein